MQIFWELEWQRKHALYWLYQMTKSGNEHLHIAVHNEVWKKRSHLLTEKERSMIVIASDVSFPNIHRIFVNKEHVETFKSIYQFEVM